MTDAAQRSFGFTVTDEDLTLRDVVRELAGREIAPRAAALDAEARFPFEHLSRLAELGVMGLNLPEELGGPGASAIGLTMGVEEIAAACGATASVVTAHYLATDMIHLAGSEEQKRRYLVPAARGELLGAFALTEPSAGSDPSGMHTTAQSTDAGYRLEGSKHFITNGGEADFLVVMAKTGFANGRTQVSAFVVDRSTPGLSVVRHEPTMGIRGSRVYELAFACDLPAACLLGQPGGGFRTAMRVLDSGRVEIAAMGLGIARAALDAAVAWATQRETFGHAIADFQGVQWMLADMETRLEAARLLTYQAAWLRGQGAPFTREASMAKLFASETANYVADLALQIHGGYGYTQELPLERYVRDARILRIFEGTSEVQRNIIARQLLRDARRPGTG